MGSTNEEAGNQGETGKADLLATIFTSLEGSWKLERRLHSSNASEPAGRCHGEAHFRCRPPSKVEGGDIQGLSGVTREMLYHEEGQFQMQAPSAAFQMPYMTFSRNYIWRIKSPQLGATRSGVSLWFAKPGTKELDYLFHNLNIDGQTPGQHNDTSSQDDLSVSVQAHGSHLCVEDQYETEYMFTFTGQKDGRKLSLAQWQTVHVVKGPNKDQMIETTFTRHAGSA